MVTRGSSNEATAMGVRGCFGAVGTPGLTQDAANVVCGGVLADRELAADLPVRESAGDELQDRDLARREVVREGLRGRGRRAELRRTRGQGDEAGRFCNGDRPSEEACSSGSIA